MNAQKWAATAKAYHDLKTAFNEHGLVNKARQQYLRERGARRCEAWTADDRLRWLGSSLAWQLTGYGVSVRRVFRNMGLVFGLATLGYLWVELMRPGHALSMKYSTIPEILYYSLITFTTTPPTMPTNDVVKVLVMGEAFLGTLLIVFLGYVLGTRERF